MTQYNGKIHWYSEVYILKYKSKDISVDKDQTKALKHTFQNREFKIVDLKQWIQIKMVDSRWRIQNGGFKMVDSKWRIQNSGILF